MESSAILPRGALLPVPVCLGMTFATEVAVAQCPDRGAVVDDEVSNTQGKPYQAKEVRTVVTYGSDPGRSSSGVNALPRIVDIPSKAKMCWSHEGPPRVQDFPTAPGFRKESSSNSALQRSHRRTDAGGRYRSTLGPRIARVLLVSWIVGPKARSRQPGGSPQARYGDRCCRKCCTATRWIRFQVPAWRRR